MSAAGDYITTATRDEQERRQCIRTFTGKYVNPLRLRAKDVCIEDIAHHLSCINRYTGATPRPFNVAHHSVLVADELAGHGARIGLAGLLHDSGEYVFNDLASPVKKAAWLHHYKRREHETTKLIFCVFGLDPELLPQTKAADDAVFRWEVESWWKVGVLNPIEPWSAKYSEHAFLERFYRFKEQGA